MCINPVRIHKNLDPVKYPTGLEVPCGKCALCRKANIEMWKTRILNEMSDKPALFITLTYRDELLPENGTLVKSDLQKFFKRLRKDLPKEKKIKYFACGEYGDTTDRPHYHGIIIGLDYDDRDYIFDNWHFADWKVEAIKNRGVQIAGVGSVNYVVDYLLKKYEGDLEYDKYISVGRISPFRLVSNGLGRSYFDNNYNDIGNNLYVSDGPKKRPIPRYYREKLPEETKEKIRENAIENQRHINKVLFGWEDDDERVYKTANKDELAKYYEEKRRRRKQALNNVESKKKYKINKKV